MGSGGREGRHTDDDDGCVDWYKSGICLIQLENKKSGVKVLVACALVAIWRERDYTGVVREERNIEGVVINGIYRILHYF